MRLWLVSRLGGEASIWPRWSSERVWPSVSTTEHHDSARPRAEPGASPCDHPAKLIVGMMGDGLEALHILDGAQRELLCP